MGCKNRMLLILTNTEWTVWDHKNNACEYWVVFPFQWQGRPKKGGISLTRWLQRPCHHPLHPWRRTQSSSWVFWGAGRGQCGPDHLSPSLHSPCPENRQQVSDREYAVWGMNVECILSISGSQSIPKIRSMPICDPPTQWSILGMVNFVTKEWFLFVFFRLFNLTYYWSRAIVFKCSLFHTHKKASILRL